MKNIFDNQEPEEDEQIISFRSFFISSTAIDENNNTFAHDDSSNQGNIGSNDGQANESQEETNQIHKLLGRRKKNSTETGGHTSESEDNKRRREWRTMLKKISKFLNKICKENNVGELKCTNFIQQFGTNFVQNEYFYQIKLFKYFTYVKKGKKKENVARTTKSFIRTKNNADIINRMLYEKNSKIFKELINLTIKEFCEKYIKKDHCICVSGVENELENFNTMDEIDTTLLFPEKKPKRKKEFKKEFDYLIEEI